jgi:5'-nucleotidase-like protein
MPGVAGRFPEVSGLCFTYDISAPVGSRVHSAVRQAAGGTCTAVDLTAAATYSLAENDFMASGGGGYPVFTSRVTTRDIMDQVLADYVQANSPVAPAIQGRVTCTTSGVLASNLCSLRGVVSLRRVGVRSCDDPARHVQQARTGRGAPPREPEEAAVADKSPRQSSSKKSGKTLKQKRADKKAAAASKDTRVHIPTRGPAK